MLKRDRARHLLAALLAAAAPALLARGSLERSCYKMIVERRMPHHRPAAARRWQVPLIVALVLVAVAGAAFAGWWYARESPPHQGPLLLISVDGLEAARLAAYGAPASDAPAIDALAADAVVFERAYTHSPLTLPAHASILAGQLPFEHGVRDEAGFALRDETRSLAELLRNRGFETGAAVSSFVLRRESGVAQGFSFFDAELPRGPGEPLPVVERPGEATVDVAERWLRSRSGQRFFLFVQVDTAAADTAVRQLIAELDALGLYDDATILLTADRSGIDAGGTLREASLRVPLIVKQPRSEGAGRRVVAPVQHIDILPTLLDLVRAPIPSGLRGRSLRAVLDGDGRVPDQPIYAELLAPRFRFGGRSVFTLATPELRYVRSDDQEIVDAGPAGPSRALATPEAEQLRTRLDRLLEAHPLQTPEDIPAANEDEYAALGYLGGSVVAGPEPPLLDPAEELRLIGEHRAAAILVGEKKYTAAIERLRAIARAHPDLAVVRYQLGTLLERTGRLREAADAFRAAARLVPDNAYVPVALARTLLRSDAYDQAAAQASLAVALAERHDGRSRAAAHEMAARVALAAGDAERAQLHADAASAEDPALPMSAFVRGRVLYDAGRYEEALPAFEEATAAAGEHGRRMRDLHWYLGDTFARLDRFPDAERQFRNEIDLFPRNIQAYVSLAMLYRATGRDGEIEAVLGDLVLAAPTPEGYATAARLWTILGERSRAQALRADARSRFRDDPSLAIFDRPAHLR